jgi:nucleotide-binding universal stress UspA family protein
MFKRILVAYDESADASRALSAAIYLAKAVGAELQAVTIFDGSSANIAHAATSGSPLGLTLIQDRRERSEQLLAEARDRAMRRGVQLVTHLVEGEEADSIIQLIAHQKADLLVIGLHRHSQYLSRLWSTVYEGAQHGLCSVLGVQ